LNIKQISKAIKRCVKTLETSTYLLKTIIAELLNIYRKRDLYKKVHLNSNQKRKIKGFWKHNYGKNISSRWHRLYQSYTGEFQEKYFPEIIYSTKLELKLNDRIISSVLSDKSFLEILYRNISDVKIPKSYLINNSGIFYSSDREIISLENAKEVISNIGEVIVKTTVDSSSGDAVRLCNFSEGIDLVTGENIQKMFNHFEKNFIVQEKIIPNKEFKTVYPNSINTLRVVTYIIEDEIYHSPLSFRVGRGGNFVDNIHAGGLVVGLNDNGMLKKFAFTEMQEKYEMHPDTNIKFEDYNLSKTNEIINLAKNMHKVTPHMRIISWDFTVNEKDEIVLLEINLLGQSVWFPQMVNGEPMFGENTKDILKVIK